MSSAESLKAVRHLIACVEATSYALVRRRILSAIAVCSIVWLASLWLGAALAEAQEAPADGSSIAVAQSATPQGSIENNQLVLSMIDRNELEPTAFTNGPQAVTPHSAAKILLPSDSLYASLRTLVSAPSSSQLNAMDAKGAGQSDTGSRVNNGKPFVYQLGAINFVINGLPNGFSVSSAGAGAAMTR
ncbi:MAG: hypothetical protein C5B58_08785 [Acidobacteria bacterium]|nr:MAG: hypothetical protein C5B58_08785 [Acidobacteriota bacterium]